MSEIPEELLKAMTTKFTKEREAETPDQRTERETREAEARARDVAWRQEREDAVRFAVPRQIEKLRKEADAKRVEADKIEALFKAFPSLMRHVGRWEKVAYYSKDVNERVDRFDMRHNCGCCNDSPLEVWPYLETPNGPVYSDPPSFQVGEKHWISGDKPYANWRGKLGEAGIPATTIEAVGRHFEQSRLDRIEAASSDDEIPEEAEDG